MYLVHLSVHGLIRGQNLELGRDADTGGQTTYVVELVEALGRMKEVGKVDLFTRRVADPAVDPEYGEPTEQIADNVRIVRIDAGPSEEYLYKEHLWDHLDNFVDNALAHFRAEGRTPDLLHSHYADAGYVGTRLAHILGVPLIHTGHSLGRVKRRRLLATGLTREQIEARYNMSRRIEAEENTLATAERVITSTHQEIEEQYALYDHYQPEQMRVIPPGADLNRFYPPSEAEGDPRKAPIAAEIDRFLNEPDKPFILALSRPDARKNISGLVTAYGESPELQDLANLVIVAGNRDDIADMDDGAQEVLTDLLLLFDRYDLYGKVSYPKHHKADDVPEIYRLASARKGVFVNPALTEPFGLTLIEAAASGIPIVATEDGGPRDIVGNCDNGLLVDVLDTDAITEAIRKVLEDDDVWETYARNGVKGVRTHYSWEAHSRTYLDEAVPVIDRSGLLFRPELRRKDSVYRDRAIFTDLDQNLLGDPDSLPEFVERMRRNRSTASFGIATGRRLDSALRALRRNKIPEPDVLITSGGTQIHYAPDLTADVAWARHIDHHWMPRKVRKLLADTPGLELQPPAEQSWFKISYYYDPSIAPSMDELNSLMHREEMAVNIMLSFGQFLDILPIRATKGLAVRYVTDRWGIPIDQTLVAGGSGADEDMMRGNTLAAVVANRHDEELSQLVDLERIYFATQPFARGILEAIDHYDFFGECRAPEPEEKETESAET
ncbi:sucrose-phosphate synthase [Rhodobium orientis]|uniref:HAD family hydrolase n=1 Tax=Rhodobium orientis TaxID=34017 RepID=UPI0017D49A97|nr:HAD family hydrolase [Rhodobium orientis]MBB4301877.1 sucrose-phosphate synthase [Rhodobium orientis]